MAQNGGTANHQAACKGGKFHLSAQGISFSDRRNRVTGKATRFADRFHSCGIPANPCAVGVRTENSLWVRQGSVLWFGKKFIEPMPKEANQRFCVGSCHPREVWGHLPAMALILSSGLQPQDAPNGIPGPRGVTREVFSRASKVLDRPCRRRTELERRSALRR